MAPSLSSTCMCPTPSWLCQALTRLPLPCSALLAHIPATAPTPTLLSGSELVKKAIAAMIEGGCEEVVLEAEVSNLGALKLYQSLGFIRDKRLHRWVVRWVPVHGVHRLGWRCRGAGYELSCNRGKRLHRWEG